MVYLYSSRKKNTNIKNKKNVSLVRGDSKGDVMNILLVYRKSAIAPKRGKIIDRTLQQALKTNILSIGSMTSGLPLSSRRKIRKI